MGLHEFKLLIFLNGLTLFVTGMFNLINYLWIKQPFGIIIYFIMLGIINAVSLFVIFIALPIMEKFLN